MPALESAINDRFPGDNSRVRYILFSVLSCADGQRNPPRIVVRAAVSPHIAATASHFRVAYSLLLFVRSIVLRISRIEVLVPIRHIRGDFALTISRRLLKHSFAATRNLSQSALRPNDILREYHAYRERV